MTAANIFWVAFAAVVTIPLAFAALLVLALFVGWVLVFIQQHRGRR